MPMFDDYERRGDYLIPSDTLEAAEREFSKRSPRSRATDRAIRGTITTDYERWKKLRGRGVDYPGVDTPRKHPTTGIFDHTLPPERQRMGAGHAHLHGDALLVEQPTREGGSLVDHLQTVADDVYETSGRFANILSPGSAPYK